MNTLKITNINDNAEMVIIQLSEYNRLKQENTELHNKINQLTNESTKLNTDILEKNLEIEMLRKENQELREKIKILEDKIANQDIEITRQNYEITKQQKEINDLKKETKDLKQDNIVLKNNNDKLTKQINKLEDDKQKFDALIKLHECNTLVNKEFKRLYRIKFNKTKYDNNIPNIGDFIRDPPTKNDGEDYNFWIEFNNKYPQSDDANFRLIYQKIANDRADYGAHVNVRKLNKTDFDKLIELVYPEEYNINKQLYNEYRDWLFMFPA